MKEMIEGWVGKTVFVSLRVGGIWPPTGLLEGRLLKVSDSGVLVGCKGQTFYVPITHIVHVSLRDGG